jgi:PAS domain S-box-containing protein
MGKFNKLALHFKAAMDSSGKGILFAVDRKYNYLFFNDIHKQAMRDVFSTDVEIGLNGLDCITIKENRTKAKQNYDRALAGETHSHIERLGVPGHYRYFESTFRPIVNDSGHIVGATAFATDISEQMEAEEALKISEAKYKSMFNNSISAASLYEVVCNEKGIPYDFRILLVNPSYEKLTGVNASDVIGRTVLEAFPQTEDLWIQTMLSTVTNGRPLTIENYSVEIDKWIEVTVYSPEKDKLVLLASNTTARKKATAELADEKERLAVTLRSIGDGVISTNLSGEITMLNRAAEELTGWTVEEAMGKPLKEIFDIFDESTGEKHQSPAAVVISKGENIKLSEKTCLITKEGKELAIADSAAPLQNNGGEIIGAVIVFRDVTETRNALRQKELLTKQLHQSQKMDAIGQLAGGIAHDFNNALSGILNAAELIKRGKYSKEEQNEFLDLIISAADRAGDLTKKLLLFSRKGSKASSPIDIRAITEETVNLLSHVLNKNISLSVEKKADKTTIIGDDAQIQNALMNLAINAGHAMPEGGNLVFSLFNLELNEEYCKASPFSLEPGNYLEITIRDTGCGMTPEIQSHIFEPFYTTKEQGKGTGLGLSTVYGVVVDHNGAITVYSEPDRGTIFHLYFKTTGEKPILNKPKDIPTGSGTILIIEDEELIRITVRAILVSLGYKVIEAENGQVGIEKYKERYSEIDLIILDMIMPVMGGRQTFEKIRGIDKEIPVIISSGFSKEDEMQKIKEGNVAGFLHKPFHREEIAEIVSQILGK